MPFSLQSSGNKDFVKSQVTGQIEGTYNTTPKGSDRDDNKSRMEKVRDYLFDDLGAEFPAESPTGLVLFGDAGKNYISITRLEFSISMPAKEADTDTHPAPDKKEVGETMSPPAPDKKPVGEGNASAQELSKSSTTPPDQKQPTTTAPNFENKESTTPPNTSSGSKF